MNTAHDLGGMHGLGPIPETDPACPNFHADWEKRAMAITLAMGATGSWNIDMSRAARENVPPAQYLKNSYFEIWLDGLEKLMLDRGMVSESELQAVHKGVAKIDAAPRIPPRVLRPERVADVLAAGSPTSRVAMTKSSGLTSTSTPPARFAIGQRVSCKLMNPQSHTRLPRYLRGREGTIHSLHGLHVFPDLNADAERAINEPAQWLYTVRFDARQVWGDGPDDTTATELFVDCWEPYLNGV